MTDDLIFADAIAQARAHSERGLPHYAFDPICRTTIDKIALIERVLARGGTLADVPLDPDLGLMAAKELGNDEADFAHALHVMQFETQRAHGRPRAG